MQIKLVVSAAAIALLAGLGSATAGDRFETLNGFQPPPLSVADLNSIVGG